MTHGGEEGLQIRRRSFRGGKLTEAFALVGGAVDKDLCGNDVPEGQEHLQDLRVGELLRQVVDEYVAAFRT